MTTGTEWGPAERFVSGSAPTKAQQGRLWMRSLFPLYRTIPVAAVQESRQQ